MRPVIVYITARDTKQARSIGKTLVAERLAACVNIFGGMNSLYFWEGGLCDDRETALIVKTRDTLLTRLVRRVKSLHSYSVPCVVALPVIGGNKEFISWIARETAPEKRRRARRR